MIPRARPAFAPLVMPCGVDAGTAVDCVFEDSVADATRKEVGVEGIVGVASCSRTELELRRVSDEGGVVDDKTEVDFEDVDSETV